MRACVVPDVVVKSLSDLLPNWGAERDEARNA